MPRCTFLVSSSRSKPYLDWILNALLMKPSLINKNYGAKPLLIPTGRGKKAGGPTVSRGRCTEHGQPHVLDLHQKAWGAKSLNAWCPVKMNEEMFYLHVFYKTVDDEESHIITSTAAAPGEHESQPELFLTCEVYLCYLYN